MPYVKIEIARNGVTKEQKQAMIKGVTEVIGNILRKDSQLIFVAIQEYDQDNFGHTGEHKPVRRKGYDC